MGLGNGSCEPYRVARMCGIGGYATRGGRPAPDVTERLIGALRHRGPDSDGTVHAAGGQRPERAGWFDASAPDGYRTAYDVWRVDSANPTSDIDLAKMHAWHDAYLRNTAAQRLDDLTTVDEDGTRWAANEHDLRAANAARLHVQTPTRFADLKPHDRFVVERDHLVECEVLGAAADTADIFGRTMKNIEVRRLDTGQSGLYMYGPEGTARRVEPPVRLRATAQPTEHDLNEAWGV